MSSNAHTRRSFLIASAVGTASVGLPAVAQSKSMSKDTFTYEVTRTEAEWRAMLSEEEYKILRDGGTEWPATGTLWNDYTEGEFHCRGCDLNVYSSEHRAMVDKGWVFFYHGVRDAVLMDIDLGSEQTMDPEDDRTLIETHCRRCGSHLGHIVYVEDKLVHCINATSLVRMEKSA